MRILSTIVFLLVCQFGHTMTVSSSNITGIENYVFDLKNLNLSEPLMQKYSDILRDAPTPKILPYNPMPIYSTFWRDLCKANVASNYQNPFNCNQFIMCVFDYSSALVYLWECPAGGQYVPGADLCGYSGEYDTCPWHSMWTGAANCPAIGQRPWWSPITIPRYPRVICGSEIVFCKNFKQSGPSKRCPKGTGYSRPNNACVPLPTCWAMERHFFGGYY